MKRTAKPVFFIVALLIVALTYTTFFGVYTYYGDRRDTIIRGAKDIRWGIDIRGGIDATFGPKEGVTDITDEDVNSMREVIADWNEKESARHAHKPFKNLTDQTQSNLRAYTENNKTQRKENGK